MAIITNIPDTQQSHIREKINSLHVITMEL